MNVIQQMRHSMTFLRQVWENKAVLRGLLGSENFALVRDYPPGHFYSPIPDLCELREQANARCEEGIENLPGIELNESRQLQMVDTFAQFYGELPFPDKQTRQFRYFFDNPYFSYGDGVILYSFLRSFKPERVVEVGSGFSSAEMLDVNDVFFDRAVEFIFIEPHPERLYSLLSEQEKGSYRIEVKPVQRVDATVFRSLAQNDVLFIDSSHVGKSHSDVLHILFEILPSLNKGVLVHFHDVMWPFEYPQSWLEEGRAFNEAYFLRAFLQHNSAFEVLFFNSFMMAQHAELLRVKMPGILKSPSTPETIGNSSLWLRKIA
jgi:predicted O-methyltransferase YrrM